MAPAAVLEVWVKSKGIQDISRQLGGMDADLRNTAGSADKATKAIDDTGKRGSKSLGGLSKAAGALGAVAGFAALSKGVTSSIAAFEESRKIAAVTENAIKATGGAANVTAKQVGGLTSAISRKTGIDDEAIQKGANLILTFKNISNEAGKGRDIFDQTTKAAVDLSAAGFGSIDSASLQLGKALNDPIKGMSALGRSGVTFSEDQKKAIGALMETGKAADRVKAQQIVLGEVQSQVGGSAAAQASATDKMKVAFGNIQESIGGFLIPVLDKAATFIAKLFQQMQDGTGAGGAIVDVFNAVKGAVSGVIGVVSSIVNWFREHKTAAVALGGALAVVTAAFVAFKVAAGIQALLTGLSTAFWAINAALAANPIGLVVIAIAALVAAFVVAYRESETFRDIIDGAFKAVSTAFGWVLEAAQNVFGWLKDHWPLVLGVLTGPIGLAVVAIKEFGPNMLDAAKWLLDQFVAGVEAVASVVVGVGGWVVGKVVEGFKGAVALVDTVGGWLKNRISDAVEAAVDGIKGIGGWILGRVVEGFKVVTDALGSIGGWLKNRIVASVEAAVDGFKGLGGWVLDQVVDGVKTVTEGLGSIGGWIKNRLKDALDQTASGFEGLGGFIIGKIVEGLKGGANLLVKFLNKLGDAIEIIPGVKIPNIPEFATGGTVGRQAIEAVAPRFAAGGVVPVRLSPGERVDYGGKSWMVPGARTAADSVFAALPPGAQVFTGHGQALLAAGASPGQALAAQRPHFGAGSLPGYGVGGIIDGLRGGLSGLWDLAKGGVGAITGALPGIGDLPDWVKGTGSWVIDRVTGWIKDKIGGLFGGSGGGGGLGGVMKAALARPPIGTPYVYGGGHGGSIAGGVDCSGGVSWALMGGNLIGGPMTTDGLKVFGEAGDGKAITIGVRGSTGRNAHTMMEIAGRFFESGSGHGWAETQGWSGNFPIHRHPAGLAKGGLVSEALAAIMDPRIVGWGLRQGGVLGSYAQGTDYVPRTGAYQLHRGESVTPAGGGVTAADVVDALRGMDITVEIGGQVIDERVDVRIERKDRATHAEFRAGVLS